MPQIIVVFSAGATAEYRVAGVPAAARAAHALAALHRSGDIEDCAIVAGPAWTPGAEVIAECARLAPRLLPALSARPLDGGVVRIAGERFVAEVARHGGELQRAHVLPALAAALMKPQATPAEPAAAVRDLRRASRDILAATGKTGDGIVSRYLNRPISRAISGLLLKVPGLTPAHASIGTAVLAGLMTGALILGDGVGLVAGAILFQAASIFDGVDGEMARATARTSDEGATLDTVIDGLTNLGFVGGVTVNLGLANDLAGALAGGTSLLMLASGLFLISLRATESGGPVGFDIVKHRLRRGGRSGPFTELLIQLTMRDFFAAASACLILVGQAHLLMLLFAGVGTAWFAVTLVVLRREAGGATIRGVPDIERSPTRTGGSVVAAVALPGR